MFLWHQKFKGKSQQEYGRVECSYFFVIFRKWIKTESSFPLDMWPLDSLQNLFHLWPLVFQGYCEEQGAVGGAGLEDDLNDLRLEEENEQPPLILETDWLSGRLYPPIRGLLWCCYEHVTQGGQGQDQRLGVFLNAQSVQEPVCKSVCAFVCSHTSYSPSPLPPALPFPSVPPAQAQLTLCMYMCQPLKDMLQFENEYLWVCALDVWSKTKKKHNVAVSSFKTHTLTQALCKTKVIV